MVISLVVVIIPQCIHASRINMFTLNAHYFKLSVIKNVKKLISLSAKQF